MKHRERVSMSLGHEEPDRCPMQISFTPEFAERLRKSVHITSEAHHNPHGGGNTYELERTLGEDMLLTSVGWANSYYANDTFNPGQDTYTDSWGVTWRNSPYSTRFGQGFYTEIVGHPLADDSAIAGFRAPDPDDQNLYSEAQWVLDTFRREYWIVGVTVTTIFETAWALRGYERLLMDFVTSPDTADAILDIPFIHHLRAAERLTRMGVDMIWIGDDIGTQNTMLVSPDTWRRFLKPRMARFISTIKGVNPGLKVAYHSDGCIYAVIPELIEIGVDVLNPVQPRSMDPALLKKTYGKRLCFWGSIDEQHTLPFGSAQDVKREVAARLSTIGKGGGLIIGPTHHVQLDTPVENVRALVEAVTNTPYRP
jgi:Uroporphyrinogen decarboxylase (URO-D)